MAAGNDSSKGCWLDKYDWTTPITVNLNKVSAYVFPIMSSVGLVITVLGTYRKASHSSCHLYMLALALADVYAIIAIEVPYLMDTFYVQFSRVMCIVKAFHFDGPKQIAIWILVLMTVDRAVAVSKPLRAATMCTVGRSKKAVAILCAVLFLNQAVWGALHEGRSNQKWTNCLIVNTYLYSIHYHLNNVMALYLPILVIAVANTLIISGVRSSANMDTQQTIDKKKGTAKKITILVISTSISFLILSFFMALTNILLLEYGTAVNTFQHYYFNCEHEVYGTFLLIGNSMGTIFLNANHVTNAYIFICSKNFRIEVKLGAAAMCKRLL
ncbi:uncharacterized protein LOC141913865 [Tubulanus polymorphus]|uniref:uncharacterized protein LOC141913865 n=1 Tax=Tubulanus polymorphus TaxID=672921 RepID=UPI003DA5A5F7